LPFAAISLNNRARGTVTNETGEFGLKIPGESLADTLSISYLGFIRREIPVKQALGNNFTIRMKREFISIPEIIIKTQVPQEIIYKSISAIPKKLWKYTCYAHRLLQGRCNEKRGNSRYTRKLFSRFIKVLIQALS